MGLIRGGLLVIVSVFFFIALLVGNLFLTMDLSLDYETIKPELVSVVKQMAEDENKDVSEITDEQILEMEEYCLNNSEYIYSEGDYPITISCDIISQGSEAIIDKGLENLVEELYYQEYDCKFLDCFENGNPSFLVSKQSKDYFNSKFYFTLTVSIILFIIIFFLVENKSNSFILAGLLSIVSALPFAKIKPFLEFFNNELMQFFTAFFSKSYRVFLLMITFGIIVLIFGILIKFFSIGFKISGFMNKFKKNEGAQVQPKKIISQPIAQKPQKPKTNFLQKISLPKKIFKPKLIPKKSVLKKVYNPLLGKKK